jgi:polar amino acid transport system substrate-binding protein
MYDNIISEIAPTGTLRAGINMANIFLVTGKAVNGNPEGVSPDIARAIANKLGVKLSYIPCMTPGGTAEAIKSQTCDIAMIANEPARAKFILFTDAYVEIKATYIVSEHSSFQTVEDIDQPGINIAVAGTSAYDLYLTRTLKNAELHRAEGLPAAVELYVNKKLNALAGLRPALDENLLKLPGARILDDQFMTVEQAIGTQLKNVATANFLKQFVEEAKTSGLISGLLNRHNVGGKLEVAK